MKYSILLESFGDLLNIAPRPIPSRQALNAMLQGVRNRSDAASIKGDFKIVGNELSKALQKYGQAEAS